MLSQPFMAKLMRYVIPVNSTLQYLFIKIRMDSVNVQVKKQEINVFLEIVLKSIFTK